MAERVEKSDMSRKSALGLSAFMGGFYGGLTGVIWNWQVGAEVGVGLASLTAGVTLSMVSSEKAVELAQQGRKVRAYLKALEGNFESAIGLAVAGATTGFGIAGPEGILWGGIPGALVGAVGFGQITLWELSKAFKQRNSANGTLALLNLHNLLD